MAKPSSPSLVGTWHIYEMELWDEDYFNMEVQAYLTVNPQATGEFQFGLVSGGLDGEFGRQEGQERLDFTWDGNDECDEASGSGWLMLKSADEAEGSIKLHGGDRSGFLARRA
jgi:hypothetical protein